jgi:hypothetical protein
MLILVKQNYKSIEARYWIKRFDGNLVKRTIKQQLFFCYKYLEEIFNSLRKKEIMKGIDIYIWYQVDIFFKLF